MARLCVIMAGLFGVVLPKSDPKYAVVLLRKVLQGTKVPGKELPGHRAKVRFREGGVEKDEPLNGEDVSFLPEDVNMCRVVNKGLFLHLEDLGDAVPSVTPDCLGVAVGAKCKDLLAGRVLLQGGEIAPAHIGDLYLIANISSNIRHQTNGSLLLDSNETKDVPRKRAANGVIYVREVAGGASSIVIGGKTLALDAAPAGDSALLRQLFNTNDQRWFVVWVTNTSISAQSDEDYDPDFHLLYDLLEEDTPRWIPKFADPEKPDKPGDPPGKCMPALMDR